MLGGSCSPCCRQLPSSCCSSLTGYGWSATPSASSWGRCNPADLNGTIYGARSSDRTYDFYAYDRWADTSPLVVSPTLNTQGTAGVPRRSRWAQIITNNTGATLRVESCAGVATYFIPGASNLLERCSPEPFNFPPESLVSLERSSACASVAVGGYTWQMHSTRTDGSLLTDDISEITIRVENEVVGYPGGPGTRRDWGYEEEFRPYETRTISLSRTDIPVLRAPISGPQQGPGFGYWRHVNGNAGEFGLHMPPVLQSQAFGVLTEYFEIAPPLPACHGYGTGVWRIRFNAVVAENFYRFVGHPSVPVGADYKEPHLAFADCIVEQGSYVDSLRDSFAGPPEEPVFPFVIYQSGQPWSGLGPDAVTTREFQWVTETGDFYLRYIDCASTASGRYTDVVNRVRLPDFPVRQWQCTNARSVPAYANVRTTITVLGVA